MVRISIPNRSPRFVVHLAAMLSVLVAFGYAAASADEAPKSSPAELGYQWLTQKSFLIPDFNQEIFDNIWTVWPKELRAKAENATPDERREMAFSRYGLTGRPEDPTKPLQYVVDEEDGTWTMNCFACHGGKVRGETIPGLPNTHYALETLTNDSRKVKLAMGRPLSTMDAGSVFVPLGKTNGTTNAVMFGVALMAFRDAHLNFRPQNRPPRMVHHDMDAPAWWHFKKKRYLYIDGFAAKAPRPLMQFMMIEQNGPKQFADAERDFEDIFAFIDSIQPPKYPFEIDEPLSEKGEVVFNDNCASCHGTYGDNMTYPEKTIPLEEIGTDPVRLEALTSKNRQAYHRSWFTSFGKHATKFEPKGYVAPPLDGIWASAPYFHNGAVPTLWHVLNPSERPTVWKRTENGYDEKRVGLEVEEFDRLPRTLRRADEIRTYFNTSKFGKSAAGHDYPDALSDDEKTAVLEYLKTL